MKYDVTLYQETYTQVIVEADSLQEASEKVSTGDFMDDEIGDVTVKESMVLSSVPIPS